MSFESLLNCVGRLLRKTSTRSSSGTIDVSDVVVASGVRCTVQPRRSSFGSGNDVYGIDSTHIAYVASNIGATAGDMFEATCGGQTTLYRVVGFHDMGGRGRYYAVLLDRSD